MNKKGLYKKVFFIIFCIFMFFSSSSCTSSNISQFEIQRPSRIYIPKNVKKIFIRKDMIDDTNDKLGIKSQLISQLEKELNSLGRFKAFVVKNIEKEDINPENEAIAIIQGSIISGGEVDRGQFTDLATCTGGIKGRLSSIGSAEIYNEDITFDNWRRYVCRSGTFKSNLSELALSSAFAVAGIKEIIPPKNQVVRIYNYKNISLFAQTNFSFTKIGKVWETLAIRSDSAGFSRKIIEKNSYRNVKESHIISLSLGSIISYSKIPIFPIPSREIALAKLSNPKNTYYNQIQLNIPSNDDFDPKEKNRVIGTLVKKTLDSFIQTISPYRVVITAEVALGGNADVVNFFKKGSPKKAIKKIEAIPHHERNSEDWYNLGLAYEASAISIEDYENARRYYITALEKSPETKIFADGIGRCHRYLKERKKFVKQTQN